MIDGHGDDLFRYEGITVNFSSNIYAHADLEGLERHLCACMPLIRHYPEPPACQLERMLAKEWGIAPEQVLVTSGATDAIYLIAQTFRDLRTFHVEYPTFSEYGDACRIFGYQEEKQGALAWLCNPNNPTGEVRSRESVIDMAKRHEILVVDQSYEDYTLEPMMTADEAAEIDHLIQIRSMTKRYAVPGLRLGVVTAAEPVVSMLRHNYRPWAVNALAVEAGKWLVCHRQRILPPLERYLSEARRLEACLNLLPEVVAYPSKTNFMLCEIKSHAAAMLKDELAVRKGMLIRDASNFTGLTPHHFRVAAQSPQENDRLVEAILSFVQSSRKN